MDQWMSDGDEPERVGKRVQYTLLIRILFIRIFLTGESH